MSPEEELLNKIKLCLANNNYAQAIRSIEQYGHFKQNNND